MSMHRYIVRKINLLPLAKFGCLLGAAAMILPGALCAFAGVQVISLLRTFLQTWQTSEFDPLGMGVPLEFDFITLLGLETAQSVLIQLDEQGVTVALLIFLLNVLGGGLLIAFTILWVGWFYNILAFLTGGVEIELQE